MARALAADPGPTGEALTTLAELDGRLRAAAPQIERAVGSKTLASWRQTISPTPGAWWWSLDQVARDAEPRPSALWAILAGLFLTIAISLTADISRRFLTGGPDFVGVFSTISQAALALLAGTAVIQIGHGWIEQTLSGVGIDRSKHHLWKAGLALVVMMLILALRFSLPGIARLYNDRGVQMQASGKTTSAIESYRRAINLNSDSPQAHYNLATAYEDILDFDAAMTEYQVAIQADPRFVCVAGQPGAALQSAQARIRQRFSLLNGRWRSNRPRSNQYRSTRIEAGRTSG